MSDKFEVRMSPLSQTILSAGKNIQVEIYEDGSGGWILEVIDKFNNSTVWDDPFETDIAALTEAKKTILDKGVDSLIGPASGRGNWSLFQSS